MSSCVYAMGKSTPGDQNPVARSSHPLLRSNLSHIFFTRELISVTIFSPFSVARDWRLNYCLIAGGGWLLLASALVRYSFQSIFRRRGREEHIHDNTNQDSLAKDRRT